MFFTDRDTDLIVQMLISISTNENEDSEYSLYASDIVSLLLEKQTLIGLNKKEYKFIQSCIEKSMDQCELDDLEYLDCISYKISQTLDLLNN